MAVVTQRPIFSERLRLSRCAVCGPNLGMYVTSMLVLNHRGVPLVDSRGRVRPLLFLEPCRACGGHSQAFVEEMADA